jgi:hypothetical protein
MLDVEQGLHKATYREEVNWAPLSNVMTAGTSNLLIHPLNRAFAHSTVVVPVIGIALSQQEVLSTVNRWKETSGCWKGAYQVHVDVAESACGHRYVLWWYLVRGGGFWAAGSAGRPSPRR